jgi:hypothetical protein
MNIFAISPVLERLEGFVIVIGFVVLFVMISFGIGKIFTTILNIIEERRRQRRRNIRRELQTVYMRRFYPNEIWEFDQFDYPVFLGPKKPKRIKYHPLTTIFKDEMPVKI